MVQQTSIRIGDLVFDLRTSGRETGDTVILLHGFPETNHMWIPLMQDLAMKGYHCIAPNLRGYSRGARPTGKKNYSVDKLAEDVVHIAKALGKGKFHLVGHDWGAAIGWYLAGHYPDLLLSWTALSVPHLQAFGEAIVHDPTQKRMSAYIRFFQFPWLPEYNLKKNDHALLKRLWKNSTAEEVKDYLSLFRERGALTATLNYYRSNYRMLKSAGKTHILGKIPVPTLFIWGETDPAIGRYGVERCKDHVSADYQLLTIKGGHWLMQTHYDEVTPQIMRHLETNKEFQ